MIALQVYAFLCVVSQYQVYYRLHKKEKRARMRRKRRERLRSGFGHEEGFAIENGSYEDDYDDEYGDDDIEEDGRKMLQIVASRSGSDIRSKNSHRSQRHHATSQRDVEKTVSDTA